MHQMSNLPLVINIHYAFGWLEPLIICQIKQLGCLYLPEEIVFSLTDDIGFVAVQISTRSKWLAHS